jgi:hypothetical protein
MRFKNRHQHDTTFPLGSAPPQTSKLEKVLSKSISDVKDVCKASEAYTISYPVPEY